MKSSLLAQLQLTATLWVAFEVRKNVYLHKPNTFEKMGSSLGENGWSAVQT